MGNGIVLPGLIAIIVVTLGMLALIIFNPKTGSRLLETVSNMKWIIVIPLIIFIFISVFLGWDVALKALPVLFTLFVTLVQVLLFSVLQIGMMYWMISRTDKEIIRQGERRKPTFDELILEPGLKQEIVHLRDIIVDRARYILKGADVSSGMIWNGPPGVGKTHAARALSVEAGCSVIILSAAALSSMFLGAGRFVVGGIARTARKEARRNKHKVAVVVLDEFDAIARTRGGSVGGGPTGPMGGMGGMMGMMGGGMGSNGTLHQLLTEINGAETGDTWLIKLFRRYNLDWILPKPQPVKVIWIGLCNTDIGELDPALVRSGRFGVHLYFKAPAEEQLAALWKLYLKDIADKGLLQGDLDEIVEDLVPLSVNITGSDITEIVKEAMSQTGPDPDALLTFKIIWDRMRIHQYGRPDGELVPVEKEATAAHEGAHAVMLALHPPEGMHVGSATVQPTDKFNGMVVFERDQKRRRQSRKDFFKHILISVASKAAELIFFDEEYGGVTQDWASATGIAEFMLCKAAMGKKKVLMDPAGAETKFERDVIVEAAFRVAYDLISGPYKQAVTAIANALIEETSIPGKRVEELARTGITEEVDAVALIEQRMVEVEEEWLAASEKRARRLRGGAEASATPTTPAA
jgi:cell division protease FtsH